jgi:hypothetical protein
MHHMPSLVLAAALLLTVARSPGAADSAVIVNSGSTNTAGFRIDVSRSGEAVYTPVPRRAGQMSEAQAEPRNRQIPSALVKRFYADLEAPKSLSRLPHQSCMKSVSFGTTLLVEYHGEKSPDLSCGDRGDATLKALIQSAGEIVKLFK